MTLSRKVLLLALLNLVVLGIALVVFARVQLGIGTESLLLGPARDRIVGIANAVMVELASTADSVAARVDLMKMYGARYGADFYLTDPDGHSLIGDQPEGSLMDLPRELVDAMHRPDGKDAGKGPPPRRKGSKGKAKEDDDHRPPPPPDRADDRPPPPPREARPEEQVFFVTEGSPSHYWAGVRVRFEPPDGSRPKPAMLLIRSESLLSNTLFFDWRMWLGVSLGAVGLSALCWLPFVRSLTGSVAQMSRVTERIAQGQFDAKVDDVRRDELGRLGSEINEMGARLGSFVKNQKRFLGDIAHELSAPIARIQFALGILEQRTGESAQVAMLREEIEEMSSLVSELLSFSKAGLDLAATPVAAVDIAMAVERAVAREAGGSAKIEVSVDAGLRALANEAYLVRAVSNLLRNAIRYAGEAGPILVSARREDDAVVIRVADSGPGVAENDLDEIFAPFYRPESSRSRETGGVGLGLAIVKTCVEACRGSVVCRNRKPSGLEVEVRLAGA